MSYNPFISTGRDTMGKMARMNFGDAWGRAIGDVGGNPFDPLKTPRYEKDPTRRNRRRIGRSSAQRAFGQAALPTAFPQQQRQFFHGRSPDFSYNAIMPRPPRPRSRPFEHIDAAAVLQSIPKTQPFNVGPLPQVQAPQMGGQPMLPWAIRHRYPGGYGGYGGGWGRGGGWNRGYGSPGQMNEGRFPMGPPNYQFNEDGTKYEQPREFWDKIETPYGPRSIDRSLPGMGQRMQGQWRADNRPPGGWWAEARDRGFMPLGGGPVRRGRSQFDGWGLMSGILRGLGRNAAQGRHSRGNIVRGGIAGLLGDRFYY